MTLPINQPYATATATKPNSDLQNFLLIVDLSTLPSLWWDNVDTSDGTRGRAANNETLQEYAVDWVDFDYSGKTGLLRIQWSGVLSSTLYSNIRIYPPNTNNAPVGSGDAFGKNACYDPANVLMYSPNGGNDDRSSNEFTLTEYNGIVSGGQSGKIGSSTFYDFNNSGYVSTPITDKEQPLTFIAWARPYSTIISAILSLGDGSVQEQYFELWYDFFNERILSTYIGDGVTFRSVTTPNPIPHGTWFQASSVFVDPTNIEVYLNGGSKQSQNTPPINPTISILTIGGAEFVPGNPSAEFHGEIQHVFIFTDVKNEDWINQEYLQTNDNSGFWGEWTVFIPPSTAFLFDFKVFNKELINEGGAAPNLDTGTIKYVYDDMIDNEGKSTLPFG